MGLFFSHNKKMSNVKFFFIVLILSVVLSFAVGFFFSDEEIFVGGLLVGFLASIYLTLLRILKNCNAPDNRLGNWKYFFTLFLLLVGLFVFLCFIFNQDEETVALSLFAAFVLSSFVSIWRGIKHWYQQRKAEKARKQQYQDRLQRENRQYAEELEKKNRIIRELQNRNSESQRRQQSTNSSQSQYDSWRKAEEERRRDEQWEREQDEKWEREQNQRKQRMLEDWYNEYVTIDVYFEYHIKDSEYNQDYWDRRNEEIRVTRREAMALIQAGEGAIIGRLGYNNRSNVRNISYKVPYGLYNRPFGC